jgi:hypothetical protein
MVVMLGQPEAMIAQRLAMLRHGDRVADRLAVRPVDERDGLIENG